MRIVCPSCQAAYDVPDRLLAGGARTVRCARCANEWTATPADAPPLPPAPAAATLSPMDAAVAAALDHGEADAAGDDAHAEQPEPRPHRMRIQVAMREPDDMVPPREAAVPSDRTAMIAWAASVLLLVALAGAAVTWRTAVMAAWPPSERVFAMIGLR